MNTKCLLIFLIIMFGFLSKDSLPSNTKNNRLLCHLLDKLIITKRKKNEVTEKVSGLGRLLVDRRFLVPVVVKDSRIRSEKTTV